jgi:hypothetical protein
MVSYRVGQIFRVNQPADGMVDAEATLVFGVIYETATATGGVATAVGGVATATTAGDGHPPRQRER